MAEMTNRPPITNPRAGGANQTYYGLTGDAARLAELNQVIYEADQILKSAPTSSARFKQAKADRKRAVNERDAMQKEAQTQASTKKQKNDLQKAQDDLIRAQALEDEAAAERAKARIKELEKTPQGKADAEKDTDGDGIPDFKDNMPSYPNPDQKTGTTQSKKVMTPTGGTGVGGADVNKALKNVDTKGLWISYLRSTFASIEDKVQKAQIDNLLTLAKQQNWDEGTFIEALKGTVWWQTTLPSMRSFFLETHDPRNASTFTEKLNNKIDTVAGKLEALGVVAQQRDPVTGAVIDNSDYIRGIAMDAIKNNWDDNQLENWLAEKGNIMFTGGGTLGTNLDKIKQVAYMYGTKFDANMEKEINLSLLDPNDGRDVQYWTNSIKQDAINNPQYKPFQESLREGRTLYEVTNSYRNQMANLLEVDSAAITWDDLLGKAVDGTTGNARTYADFTKALKQDPLWQYTRNAKETYSDMALDLAKMFGFAG